MSWLIKQFIPVRKKGPNSVGRVESSPGQDESKMMSGKSSGSTGSKFSHTSGRGIKRTSGEGVGHQEVR